MSKQKDSPPHEARRGVIIRTDGSVILAKGPFLMSVGAQWGLSTTTVDIVRQV